MSAMLFLSKANCLFKLTALNSVPLCTTQAKGETRRHSQDLAINTFKLMAPAPCSLLPAPCTYLPEPPASGGPQRMASYD